MENWETSICPRARGAARRLRSPAGEANRFIRIWAYKRPDERAALRNTARWPPPGGADTLPTMANNIMMPSAFSPVQ